MQKFESKNGVSVRAYKGDAMTLLAFDLTTPLRKDLAGFTIFFSVKGNGLGQYFFNRLVFPDKFLANNPEIPLKGRNSSLYSPIQKMNWVHVPNTDITSRQAVFGEYHYEITPRYIKAGKLLPLDKSLTVKLNIDVSPFDLNKIKVRFTRGFVSSVAYAKRFGDKNNKVRPAKSKDKLLFDIKQKSGTAVRYIQNKGNQPVDYTFEEQHDWLGWQARKTILDFLDEAIKNKDITIKAFVYDLDEPEISRRLLQLADDGRLQIIVDNAGEHDDTKSHESEFVRQFKKTNAKKTDVYRGKFGALAHSKVFIQLNKAKADKVLTGSTNFSTNGLYINSNHVLVFDNKEVAKLYEDVFDASFGKDKMSSFKKSVFATKDYSFANPAMTITFAPHPKIDTDRIFKRIVAKINKAGSDILFAIMNDKSKSGILDAVQKKVKSNTVFTYGITDTIGKKKKDYTVHLYRPDSKRGIRVAAKGVQNLLPPPFGQVPGVSGYAIHHKFIVADFKGEKPVVYCGSSNLAYGPEQRNGDNLLEIFDTDVVTAFAIEALRLVDHFHWRNYEDLKSKPMNLDDLTREKLWSAKWFTPGDLYCKQRELYIRK
jgi:phosphatidylserine/phosphatidylglycerophosphate/cardiolipin synthase-like enzyme